ncbi:MAG TPA: SdpI family protein [Usitatibacteraceae bacterium]|nr:SdpI family protein [Usitatibacteraceae bacterium]
MLLLIGSGVIAAVSIPLILGFVPPNRIYGFRTRQTLSNEALWYQANFFAGWAFLIAAFASVVLLALVRGGAFPGVASEVAAFALPVVVAIVACFVYLRRITDGVAGGRR